MKFLKIKDWSVFSLFFLLAVSPIVFGARHPFIQGFFTTFILLTGGIWLVMHFDEARQDILAPAILPPFLLILCIFLTSLPLPLSLLGSLSPVRAEYMNKAIQIAQLTDPVTSLSYFAPGTRLLSVFLFSLLLLFLFSSILLRKKNVMETALWIITAVGTLEAFYGLLQAMLPSLGVLWLPSEISAQGCARGTIIYRNQYATFMNMCWPLAITLGIILYKPVIDKIRFRAKMKNRLTLAEKVNVVFQKATIPFWASLFMLLAVIFSESRGGITIMILTGTLLLFFLPVIKKLKLAVFSVFIVLIGLYGGMIGFQDVLFRFRSFFTAALGRITLWTDSLSMLKDHLITGIGMGSYKFLSPLYLQNVPGNNWYDFAHNEYIELAIELGLPLMILFLVWTAWGMGKNFLRVRHAKKLSQHVSEIEVDDRNIIIIGSYCAITGFMLHGFVDFIWRLPANAMYCVILLAILSAGGSRRIHTDNE